MNHLRFILILVAVVSLAPSILGQAFGKNVLGSLLLHRRHSTTAPTSRVKFVTQRHTAPRRVSTTRATETKADVDSLDGRPQPGKPVTTTRVPQQQQSTSLGFESSHVTRPEQRLPTSEHGDKGQKSH